MTIKKYSKADLLWEATRRNEDYKKDYLEVYKDYAKENPHISKGNIKRLPLAESDRWRIKMMGEDQFFKSSPETYWLDPKVSFEEIQEEIMHYNNVVLHPYYHLFQSKKLPWVFYYYRDSSIGLQNKKDNAYEDHLRDTPEGRNLEFFEYKINETVYVCIKRSQVDKKILLMIDPLKTDDEIQQSVKEIKNEVLKTIKRRINTFIKSDGSVFYPNRIKEYIGWLEKYDQIVEYIQKDNNLQLSINNGVIDIPDNFNFSEMVPDEVPGKKFAGVQKNYLNAYRGSIKLIQQTPNIVFSPAKSK